MHEMSSSLGQPRPGMSHALGVEALSLSGAAQLPAGLGEQVGERPGNGGAHG